MYTPDLDWLRQVVDTAVSAVSATLIKQSSAPAALYRLQLTLPDDVGIFYGDRARLRQILLNLLGNAAKFTDNGDIAFGVARDETADGAAWVRFTVADTGIGISSAHLAHLFEPFVQVDPSSTRRYEGTGLGLAISHRFCQMMGGHITVESQVGRGSTFTVHLPVAAVAVSV